MSPTFGSLFAGIGGIDLGLERAGWTGRWQVEWDPFCQHVLAHHWPDVPRYGDITRVDWSAVEPVDFIAGGFPCQPFSFAGKQRGVGDERWLWPEFARAVRSLRPRYVLVENVPGLLAGHGGMGAVLADLADLGYDAEWDSIPAAAVGAPHLRYRVWIVAYPASRGARRDGTRPVEVLGGLRETLADATGERRERWPRGQGDGGLAAQWGEANGDSRDGGGAHAALAHPDGTRLEGRQLLPERAGERPAGPGGVGDAAGAPPDALAARRGPRGAAGEPGWWRVEPDVGRVAHGVPARVDRLRALGNAVVPQVVEVIGRRILDVMDRQDDAA